jgi:hypothetical protein
MVHVMTQLSVLANDRSGDRGPHPGILALVSLVLLVAGLAISGAMSGGDALHSPYGATATVVGRIAAHHEAIRVLAFFQLGSAVPLGIYTATVYARQLRLGVRVPGPVIGLVGGIVAVTSQFVAAGATYVESRPEVTIDAPLTQAFAFLAFVAGGPAFAVGLGLLIAGSAVPAFVLRLVPRWLAVTGLALAVVGELAWLSMLVEPLQLLIPVTRFVGAVWLIGLGFQLPRNRHEVPAS